MPEERARWWQAAACAGEDPSWWSDDRQMWPAAVRLCLACPVRQRCLDEAIAHGDSGVIRGGALLVETVRGHHTVPLICAHCGVRPVRLSVGGGVPRYCGRACQAAGARSATPIRSASPIRPPARVPAGVAVVTA